MADIRINSLPSTATSFNTDDYIAIDGASAGTRKMLAATLPLTDVTFGASGPSAKSSIAARAARQGLVFDGTAGVSANIGTIGSSAVSFGGRCTIPASGTNVLFAISASATTGAQAKSLAIYTFGTSLYVQLNAALGNYLLGEVSGFVTTYAGKVVDILAVRSTSGNIALYVNGVATSPSFTSVGGSAPANWQADIDGPYALLGITSISAWVAGTFYPPVYYNRALTAAEVVSLYEAGVPAGADYNTANNTGFVTGDNSTFASDTGFWTRGANVAITGGEAVWTGASSLNRPSISLLAGKRYLFTINITQASTNGWSWYNGSAYISTGITGTGVQSAVLVPVANTGFYITNGDGTNGKITDLTLIPQGLLLAPDAAQAGGGLTWYDTSGNAANITLPASGVSWNVPTSGKMATNLAISGTATNGLTVSGASAYVLGFGSTSTYTRIQGYTSTALAAGANISLQPDASNVLIGTTTDGGQKLQVNGTALLGSNNASLGAYFDYDVGVPGSATLWLKQTTKSASTYTLSGGGTYTALNAPSGGTLYLRIANGDGLTITATGATFAGTAIFGKAGANATFSANGTTAESGIYTQPNTGFVFFADNASATKGIKVDVNNGGLTVLSGGLTTATAGGSAGTWKLGVYSATAPSATGYVTIDIGGTTYKLLAST